MHSPYMYNYIGPPWKTQKTIRELIANNFAADAGGLPGNEDCGQMSSWYIFGAMGFYPTCPGSPTYQIGSPSFDNVSMNLSNGKVFAIIAINNSKDTFRSLHPLRVILKPQETTDVNIGMLNAHKEGGWMPKWPNPWYSNIMMGTHADAVVADAYVKGIRGFDTELAFESMLKNATQKGDRGFSGRVGIDYFNEIGYVPTGVFGYYGEPVARTLEFSYDDYCSAQMAKALGKDDYYTEFMQRSKRYLNVLDPETKLVRGKNKDGEWLPPFDKTISVWAQGTEEDTKNYYYNHTLLVPHDIPGLADFMGGKDSLVNFLDEFFVNDMYYVGDEYSMHSPYMYNYIGPPWKTQKTIRELIANNFAADAGGLPGNDDCGQVSSWYIFGAMAFILHVRAIRFISCAAQYSIKLK